MEYHRAGAAGAFVKHLMWAARLPGVCLGLGAGDRAMPEFLPAEGIMD